MGSIIRAAARSLVPQANLPVQAMPSMGGLFTSWSLGGVQSDLLLDTGGLGTTFAPTPPTGAVAVEIWVPSKTAGDYIFYGTAAGSSGFAAAGSLAGNEAANLLRLRYVQGGGASAILPILDTSGASTLANFRFGRGVNPARMPYRWIIDQDYPFAVAGSADIGVQGTAASMQPFPTGTGIPLATEALALQCVGTGNGYLTHSGAASATLGIPITAGDRILIDPLQDGIVLTDMRVLMPTTMWLVGRALRRVR